MRLFDDVARHDRSPASYGEDSFSFLNRADGVVWERIRHVLDAWFAEYPPEHAADLRGKFRSPRPGQHWAAWWELYLHRLFYRLGYRVSVHPDLPGTSKQPDFLLERGHERLYVEAAVVFSGVVDEEANGTRDGWILDAVNAGSSASFTVGMDFVRRGAERPRNREVYGPLQNWLAGLDPDEVLATWQDSGDLPRRTFEVRDWSLQFTAYPVDAEFRQEPPGRLLAVGPMIAGTVDDKEQVRDTLQHKSSRYGEPDLPLVVAVNCASSFMKPNDIDAALCGSRAVQYTQDGATVPMWVRVRDGVWMGERGPRRRRLSAVLTAVQLHPWTAVESAPQLWHNPWASRPLLSSWPFTTWTASDHGHVKATTREPDMASLLGLPRQWPGPESPFD